MPHNPVYAIVDTASLPLPPEAAAEAALRGGVRWLQYRDKTGDRARRRREAVALQRLCERYRATLIVNDDPDLALECGAGGVHLGREDIPLAEARRRLGPRALIGATCHDSLALARQAAREGADYVAFGRFFPSRTKPGAPPASLELLAQARRALPDKPLVAIGGITLDNAPRVLAAGADRLAVSAGLFDAPNIETSARAFADLLQREPSTREDSAR